MIKHYYNGVIHTLSEMGPVTEICFDDESGMVVALGAGCTTIAQAEKIDLQGMCMVPGFCDSHLHVISLGQAMDMVDLTETKTIEEVKTALKKKLQEENPPILRGFGWNQDNWTEGRFPTREDLDQVCMDRLLVITRVCGHIMCTNSFTIEAMAVDVNTPIEGGAYGMDASGKSNGLFYENARKQIYEFLPRQSVESLMASIERAQERLVSQGICSVHANDVRYGVEPHYAHVWEAYKRLEAEGRLKLRFYHQNLVYSIEDMKNLLALGLRTGNGTEWSKQGPYKIMLDGSLGGRTAYLSKPYEDDPTTQGILCYDRSTIKAFYELAEKEGQQFIIHAIGDGAMTEIFKAYEESRHEGGNPLRHGIVHCQITSPDILDAFRKTGMEAYIQPIFLDYDSKVVKERVGEALESTSYNWRYFYDHGINAPMSSDAPIETTDVLKGIYSAVARCRLDQSPTGGYFPEFKLTASEALYGYAVAAAYSSFDENVKGRLKVGYYADATILDHDILTCSEEALLKTKVLSTIVAGRMVFEND
jgi:hypothetical protein